MKINVLRSCICEQLSIAIEHHEQMLIDCRYALANKIANYINDINYNRQNTFFKWVFNGFKTQNIKEITPQFVLEFFDNNNTDTKDFIDVSILIYIPYHSERWISHTFSNRRIFNLTQKIKKMYTILRMIEVSENDIFEINEEDFGLIWYD